MITKARNGKWQIGSKGEPIYNSYQEAKQVHMKNKLAHVRKLISSLVKIRKG